MSKKQQKDKKQTNNLHKYFNKNSSSQQKSTPPTASKNQGKKKIITNTHDSHSTRDRPTAVTAPKKLQLQHYLKQTSFQEVLQKCPKISELVDALTEKVAIEKKSVQKIMKKYIESSCFSLWSNKYAPREISQLFNIKAGEKIRDWLDAFFQYKNKISEEDSFINDGSEHYSNKIKKSIQDHQWRLLALIVRGRPGVGKTTAIRAVAQEMDIDLQECGNEYNQIKYLKEKNESTQSESVKTAYTHKTKIEKNAQMITKFMPFLEKEKQKPKETKKGQMFHNISMIYPESEASKFYNQLSRCVQLSKIPFIMTNSGQKLPAICQKYDIIEYQTVDNKLIDKILYVIYHLQSLQIIDKTVEVQKQHIFQQINSQMEMIEFRQLCSIECIHQICLLFNYRLDYIFTFLQHHKNNIETVNVFPMIIEKYKGFNEDQLLEEIMFINFERLKTHKGQKSVQTKIDDTINTLETNQTEKPKEPVPSITTWTKKLKLLALQDTIKGQDHLIPYPKDSFDKSQWETYPYTCIEVPIHLGIKKSLVSIANTEINSTLEKTRSSLKMKQLSYLPMLMREKRANRTSRVAGDVLKKIYHQTEYCYLQNFGSFIVKGEN